MANDAEFRPTSSSGACSQASVDFVVIGGIAVVVHGPCAVTAIWTSATRPTAPTSTRWASVLVQLEATCGASKATSRSCPDGRTLRNVRSSASTLRSADSISSRALRARRATNVFAPAPTAGDIAGVRVPVASIDDLLAMKRAARTTARTSSTSTRSTIGAGGAGADGPRPTALAAASDSSSGAASVTSVGVRPFSTVSLVTTHFLRRAARAARTAPRAGSPR